MIFRQRVAITPWMLAWFSLCFLGSAKRLSAQETWQHPITETETTADNPMLKMLRERVAKDPGHSDSWRLIGKIEKQSGNLPAAMEANEESLRLDPFNVAAHFDMGQLLLLGEKSAQANTHFQSVFSIAPDSSYAQQLTEQGISVETLTESLGQASQIGAVDSNGSIQPASHEIQTFDNKIEFDRRIDKVLTDTIQPAKRLKFAIEAGGLYNSNVSLTPISRELARSEAASFQGILNPEIEWTAYERDDSKMGVISRGYFTVNEDQFSAFNLASFQPGFYLERDFQVGENNVIGRIDYVYSLDLLAGKRFGDRHSIMASVLSISPDFDIVHCYVATNMSQFDSDGTDPSVESLDGTSVSGGISRFFRTDWEKIPTWSGGVVVERANTEGDNFRYNAINFNLDTTLQISPRWSFLPSAGIGGRSYPDFTGTVDRDELTYRIGGKLRWQKTDRFSISLIAGYDRFASDNDAFDSERTQAGVTATYRY